MWDFPEPGIKPMSPALAGGFSNTGTQVKFYHSVQSLSHVLLFESPWTAACQDSLSITYSQSFLRLISIEWVMPSNHLILCHPLLLLPSMFPASGCFQMSPFFASGGQSIGVSASASLLPMNIQDWSPLGRTGWISSWSKWLSSLFQHHSSKVSILQHSGFYYSPTLTSIHDYWKNHSFD